jgi:hypothetical protein
MKPILSVCLLLALTCAGQRSARVRILNPGGATIAARFNPPPGFSRLPAAAGSYGYYLRNLPLKPHGAAVYYYDGREKPNPGIYAAVLGIDVGKEDLQQCADAVMRLRAEYLYSAGQRAAIQFRFTNGFQAGYSRWMQGFRIAVDGNKAAWVKRAEPADNYASFRRYLDKVFTYAGTRSLAAELEPAPFSQMAIGDVLIVGGSPGHAVTVMDMAQNAAGRKAYLLSQSYMPAQDIQILCNPGDPAISPWYELPQAAAAINTPQWDFTTADLKRFKSVQ